MSAYQHTQLAQNAEDLEQDPSLAAGKLRNSTGEDVGEIRHSYYSRSLRSRRGIYACSV